MGKPDSKKNRYVYTKVEKKPQFLIMGECNLCPFLINDFENGEAKCGKFINPKSSWKDQNFIARVYGYTQAKAGSTKMRILTHIDIPFWCGLPTHIVEISPNDAINYIKNGKLQVESGQNYANTIQIIDSNEVIVSNDDGESLIYKPKKSTYVHYGRGGKSHDNSSTYTEKKSKVCSLCGNERKTVNRNEHLGMCDRCWGKFKFSHPKRYKAKINNFRLKRKKDWKNTEFKSVIF